MRYKIMVLMISVFFIPGVLFAQKAPSVSNPLLAATIAAKSAKEMDAYLSTPDAYGTPPIIKLARQGDVKALRDLKNTASTGKFLLATDKYGNNLFHVAKNAQTVQAIASLMRHYYGAQTTSKKITKLVDKQNKLGETPLQAQINAAHPDTFRLIYGYTSLKKKNDTVRTQLAHLQGVDERLFEQHKSIYCQGIIDDSSAHGITLLQAAQAQIPYNPQMAQVAGVISRVLPCLAQN